MRCSRITFLFFQSTLNKVIIIIVAKIIANNCWLTQNEEKSTTWPYLYLWCSFRVYFNILVHKFFFHEIWNVATNRKAQIWQRGFQAMSNYAGFYADLSGYYMVHINYIVASTSSEKFFSWNFQVAVAWKRDLSRPLF